MSAPTIAMAIIMAIPTIIKYVTSSVEVAAVDVVEVAVGVGEVEATL